MNRLLGPLPLRVVSTAADHLENFKDETSRRVLLGRYFSATVPRDPN